VARFTLDLSRVNFSIVRRGKEYNLRVIKRAQTVFTALLNLLPSNYISAVQGPNYTNELKAVAVELAKIELALEDVDLDRDFQKTRSEFLYSIIGYMVFLNNRLPPLEFNDEEFRRFLLSLIKIYFQGSVPDSIKEAVGLFISDDFQVLENFLLTRAGVSGLDISDQFGFTINVETTGTFPPDVFNLQASLRIILDIVRPAHTIFRIRFIFKDDYNPNDPVHRILDTMKWRLSNYYYEDYRSYWCAVRDRDRLGMKTNMSVIGEDHSEDF
jgi:hypothetical protein